MSIPFTQYLLPDGREKQIAIDRPEDIENLAICLMKSGYHFDAEVLCTGEVSFTCERDGREDTEVLSIEICQNGPPVLEAIDKMIREASKRMQW
jgi:hypothetical protein